ncbi:MAG TPA: hypothetical protein PLB89_04925 [Flavobacteriales bacterium]|nr:hypothetical protein [Flavobacteriales bacterium]
MSYDPPPPRNNAFPAKRMAQVQHPRSIRWPHDFSVAQGFANAMERTLDLLDDLDLALEDPSKCRKLIEDFRERQYVAPPVRS